MRKTIGFLLTVAMFFGLCGCETIDPGLQHPDSTPLAMTPGTTYSSYEGVEIQVDSLNWNGSENETSFVVIWNNTTKHDVTYGAAYTVERLEGEQWVSCAMQGEMSFIAIGYELKAGSSREETYSLTGIYDVSSPGVYRFKADCYVHDNGQMSTKCELVAEFTVGNMKDSDGAAATGTKVDWCAQYIRTDCASEAGLFPGIRIIRSLQELKDYYNTWQEVFDLERKEQVYSDTTIGFLDVCDQFDQAFFEKNYLIFVLLEEGSGSVRHEVRSVSQTANREIVISIDRKVPEAGTCDEAQWHIILELSRDVLVENSGDTVLYIDGKASYMDDKIVVPQTEGAFKKPPEGKVITPEGEEVLHLGGYSWICALGNGLENAAIADQASRPLPKGVLEPVTVSSQYAETVYAPVPGSDTYAPANSLGYLIKLQWEADPASVTFACWPETVWETGNVREETVVSQDGAFYAKQGGYVYEIVAAWEDTGAGYYGTANYYIYIIG